MPVDWKSAHSADRLLSAVIASMEGQKLDMRRIAVLYGEGATYDAMENRFRTIKREATKLRDEIDNGERPAVPATTTTPRKKKSPNDGVTTGRITKTNTSTGKTSPNKSSNKRASTIKKEAECEGDSASQLADDDATYHKMKMEDYDEASAMGGDET